ncbi:MAG: hypothetical protein JWL89_349 [Candidatus Saccharibacteria bacterium]|nr:hypothetical protein [Candidatus Saccharibacteria bacterium]
MEIEIAPAPERTGHIEQLGIQEVEFTMPTAPLIINGEPYLFQADTDRLTKAIRYVRSASLLETGERELMGVHISLGESLPESVLKDPLPKQHLYDPAKASVAVEIPSLIVSPKPAKKVVELVQNSINTDLERGLNQSIYMRDSYAFRKAYTKYGTLALAGVGIAIGVATGDSHAVPAVVGEASGGALVGASTNIGLLSLKTAVYDNGLLGVTTWKEKKLDKAARRAAKHTGLQKWFSTPVITLVRQGQEEIEAA